MTVITAPILYSNIATGTSDNIVEGLGWPPTPGLADIVSLQLSAPVDNNQPILEPGIHLPAQRSMSPNDTFYNRIIVDPSELQLGNLLSTQTRTLKLWNGFLSQRLLEDFLATNASGITVLEPVDPPYPMLPLQELTYTFSVTLDGPAVIDAYFQWIVDGSPYTAHVTGSRLVVFPFPPNWNLSKVTETLAWMTDVMRAFSGKEQRRSLRTKARRSFQYVMSAHAKDASFLDNLLWGWQNRSYAFPVWTDRSRLTLDQNEGDPSLSLTTQGYSFVDGGLAVIYDGVRTYEVVEIDTVSPTGLRLARPTQNPYPAGQLVMPMVIGHLPTAVSISRMTDNTLSAPIMITTEPTVTDAYTPDAPAPVSYQGLDVMMVQPNWDRGLSINSNYEFEVLDNNTGKIVWDATEHHPSTERVYSWNLNDRAAILAFRQFLGRMRGKAKTCWVPSWHDDFRVVANVGTGDANLIVEDNGFRTLVGLDESRNHLMIRLYDGRYFFRQIISVAGTEENCSLQLDSALGVALTPQDIRAVHLLQRSRFGADAIDIVWETDTVSTVNSSFVTVPQ